MQRTARIAVLLAVTVAVGGCSIAGTWKTVKSDPEDAMAHTPFGMVTFTDQGEYSASQQHGSEVSTMTGKYKWDGTKLTVMPADGEQRVYPGHQNIFTGQLILTHKMDDKKVTAWMEKVGEEG